MPRKRKPLDWVWGDDKKPINLRVYGDRELAISRVYPLAKQMLFACTNSVVDGVINIPHMRRRLSNGSWAYVNITGPVDIVEIYHPSPAAPSRPTTPLPSTPSVSIPSVATPSVSIPSVATPSVPPPVLPPTPVIEEEGIKKLPEEYVVPLLFPAFSVWSNTGGGIERGVVLARWKDLTPFAYVKQQFENGSPIPGKDYIRMSYVETPGVCDDDCSYEWDGEILYGRREFIQYKGKVAKSKMQAGKEMTFWLERVVDEKPYTTQKKWFKFGIQDSNLNVENKVSYDVLWKDHIMGGFREVNGEIDWCSHDDPAFKWKFQECFWLVKLDKKFAMKMFGVTPDQLENVRFVGNVEVNESLFPEPEMDPWGAGYEYEGGCNCCSID